MRYVVTWRERATDSDAEFEAARKRVLEAFSTVEKPTSLTIHHFVARVGLGGYAVVETDEPADLQYLVAVYEPIAFAVEPVVAVANTSAVETHGIDRRHVVPLN